MISKSNYQNVTVTRFKSFSSEVMWPIVLQLFQQNPSVVALHILVLSFQAVAMRLTAKLGQPGTGNLILSLFDDLVCTVFEDMICTEKIYIPSTSLLQFQGFTCTSYLMYPPCITSFQMYKLHPQYSWQSHTAQSCVGYILFICSVYKISTKIELEELSYLVKMVYPSFQCAVFLNF